jgi:DNA repair protein RecO (recombination protein O)
VRAEDEPGFVLHRRPFGETSVIVELLTLHHGRLSAIAKGAKASPKRGKDLLQAAVLYRLNVAGSGELPQLRSFEPLNTAPHVEGERLLSLLYINELLLNVLAKNDPQPAVFSIYGALIADIASGPIAPMLRQFEFALLKHLGYAPNCCLTSENQPIEPETHYRLDPSAGLVSASGPGRTTYSGLALRAFAQAQFDGEFARAARRFTRELLSTYLHGRQLRSWSMLAEMEALRESAREH